MAKGESTWSSRGKQPAKPESKPLPDGKYTLQFVADWTQKCSNNEGSIPYLNGSFKVQGTAGASGKDRRVFAMIFLGLAPGKDGIAMVDRSNGLLGLLRAVGTEVDFPSTTINGKELLNPGAVKQWLNSLEGTTVEAMIKIEKGTDGYADKNRISYFIETAPQEETHYEETETTNDTEEEAAFETTPPPRTAKAVKNGRVVA